MQRVRLAERGLAQERQAPAARPAEESVQPVVQLWECRRPLRLQLPRLSFAAWPQRKRAPPRRPLLVRRLALTVLRGLGSAGCQVKDNSCRGVLILERWGGNFGGAGGNRTHV